jgi:hypothetical protein
MVMKVLYLSTGIKVKIEFTLLLLNSGKSLFGEGATYSYYADSAGADIISSSLGYFNFDDPSLNYKISKLDGKTAFITRVADIAASKGILVVNSAGKERNNEWKHIISPAEHLLLQTYRTKSREYISSD